MAFLQAALTAALGGSRRGQTADRTPSDRARRLQRAAARADEAEVRRPMGYGCAADRIPRGIS
jgi:hypothetical protein